MINFELTDLYYLLTGFVCASVIFLFYISNLKKEIKTLKRQYEKKSVGMDDSSLRVKTLENKIKTLETALKKQMENNN
ncbi:MAG: hypothetical protein IJ877_07345 [Candidatus Gastranaerophilales bacterium]|nr:hypothetical protein [Candidatus Gastranaerophilales bacterium]